MAENGLFGDSPQATPFLLFRLPVLLSYPLFLSFSLPAASFSPLFMPFSPPFLPFYLSLLSFSMRFLSFLLSFCASFARFCGIQSFLPNAVNPARYMAARRAERCFAEGDRALQGLHPASSTAASVDNLATMDVAAWVYCRHTRSFVQASLVTPTSDADLNASSGSNVSATSGNCNDGIDDAEGGGVTARATSASCSKTPPSPAFLTPPQVCACEYSQSFGVGCVVSSASIGLGSHFVSKQPVCFFLHRRCSWFVGSSLVERCSRSVALGSLTCTRH